MAHEQEPRVYHAGRWIDLPDFERRNPYIIFLSESTTDGRRYEPAPQNNSRGDIGQWFDRVGTNDTYSEVFIRP